jgi:A/G-specific adenine glycosylase
VKAKLFQTQLLQWYDAYGRDLPWRSKGVKPDPYHVWLSEVMLQQTTVPTVKSYFLNFLHLWPTVDALANASLDEVLHAWQGLGYYARARNLHKCANDLSKNFYRTKKELLTLPGIGPYTASAIAAIAFDEPETVVDGNIERIMARLFRIETPLPSAKKEIHQMAQTLTPQERAGDYAQALMDLGSSICTPRAPKCVLCPVSSFCEAKCEDYPRRLPKTLKPTRYALFYWIENEKGEILLEKRPPSGLLGGMMGFPSSPWLEELSIPENLQILPGHVKHTFTHFHLICQVAKKKEQKPGLWVNPKHLHEHALPTLMKKIGAHAQKLAQS